MDSAGLDAQLAELGAEPPIVPLLAQLGEAAGVPGLTGLTGLAGSTRERQLRPPPVLEADECAGFDRTELIYLEGLAAGAYTRPLLSST
jgi:hypothetical protein